MPRCCLVVALIAAACPVLVAQTSTPELERTIARQQSEINELRATVAEQKELLSRVAQALNIANPAPVRPPSPPVASEAPPVARPQGTSTSESPLTIHAGNFEITPGGFLALSGFLRTTDLGSGETTSFNALPFANTPAGHLKEQHLTAQTSRIFVNVKTTLGATSLLGYVETDFLGAQPANGFVTSNSNAPRLRLAFVDVNRGRWEVLGGQAYSFLTPNRVGLSPLPRDLFVTQVVDLNFHVGLTWTRAPQLRVVYHPSKTWALGLAFENADPYIGGAVTVPASLATAYGQQLDTGALANPNTASNLHPDIIPKVAYDSNLGSVSTHLEAAGLFTTFHVYDSAVSQTRTSHGYGGSLAGNLGFTSKFHLVANAFISAGGGRYLVGQGPDLVIRPDGTPSPVKSGAILAGFEYQASPRLMVYSYYGGDYFKRAWYADGTGALSGYGYPGSSASDNREIQEATFGMIHTLLKSNQFGALQVNSVYSWLGRSPWYVAPGQPKNAHLSQVYLDFRYVAP